MSVNWDAVSAIVAIVALLLFMYVERDELTSVFRVIRWLLLLFLAFGPMILVWMMYRYSWLHELLRVRWYFLLLISIVTLVAWYDFAERQSRESENASILLTMVMPVIWLLNLIASVYVDGWLEALFEL